MKKVCIRGAISEQDRNKLFEVFKLYNIKCTYGINSITGFYRVDFIEGVPYIVMSHEVLSNLIEVSVDEFIQNIKDTFWFRDLKPGDVVTIAERIEDGNEYPYTFCDEMAELAGKKFTIKQITENVLSEFDLLFYNGDRRAYFLNDEEEFTWHSSMFVKASQIPVKQITLTNISINPLSF